jgi:hypothetical protein
VIASPSGQLFSFVGEGAWVRPRQSSSFDCGSGFGTRPPGEAVEFSVG